MGLKQKINWSPIDSFDGNFSSASLALERTCPICSSSRARVILELEDFQFYSDSSDSPKRMNLRENICLDCFTLYLNPCYSGFGFKILFDEAGQSYGSSERRPQEQIDWLLSKDQLRKGSSILDVGCYEGSFLARLPDNILRMGVDIDQPAIDRARANYVDQKIQFFLGDFETFHFDAQPPDTITMFHVLEHLPRPVAVLKKLHSISSKNTKLVVEVPILENGQTNDINGFFSAQHLTHFSRQSLHNCLALSGWKIIDWLEQSDYNGCRVLAETLNDSRSTEVVIKSNPDDFVEATDYRRHWFASLKAVEDRIARFPSSKKIVVWGGGMHTEFLYQVTSFFERNRESRFIIVDSDPLKQGKTWRGVPIYSPAELDSFGWSSAMLVISSYGGQESIVKSARQLGVPELSILRLYDSIKKY